MLIIAGSNDVNITSFIAQIQESSCDFSVQSFDEWQKQQHVSPQGFVYIQVMPEVTFKRLLKTNPSTSLETIQTCADNLNNYFVHKVTMPQELHAVPVLILNGFVDFQTDLSQFYNHLFYIKKFFNAIKEQEDKRKGVSVAPKKHSGCKC